MFVNYLNVCDLSLLEGREEEKHQVFVVCFFLDVCCNSPPDSRECRSVDCF